MCALTALLWDYSSISGSKSAHVNKAESSGYFQPQTNYRCVFLINVLYRQKRLLKWFVILLQKVA